MAVCEIYGIRLLEYHSMLADFSAWMRAYRVEIAQVHNRPSGSAFAISRKNCSHIYLVQPYGLVQFRFRGFTQRHFVVCGVTVAEDEKMIFFDIALHHCLAERHVASRLFPIVRKRFCHRFTNSFKPRKMNHAGDFMFTEDFVQQCFVTDIALNKKDISAGDFCDPTKTFGVRVAEIVDHDGGIACIDQLHTGVLPI